MNLMERYSAIYGIPLKEVKEWVNNYAIGKVPESVKEWMEETKEDRIKGIKEYIQSEVDSSSTFRIQSDSIYQNIEQSKPIQVAECPF